MSFRLRYLQHDLWLPLGKFLIGRSPDCQLSLDDPLVSRRHAELIVSADLVQLADLGSRNGLLVNGHAVQKLVQLQHADRITLGSQLLVLLAQPESWTELPGLGESAYGAASALRETLSGSTAQPCEGTVLEESSVSARRLTETFQILAGVADKAFALGRAEEAERLLGSLLGQLLSLARHNGQLDGQLLDLAGVYGARLAGATAKGTWVDYVIALHAAVRKPCAAATIDALLRAHRRVRGANLSALHQYAASLRDSSLRYGPAERFLIQRIEGLERALAVS